MSVWRAAFGAALSLAASAACASERPPPTRAELAAVDGVLDALERKDCALAASRLNVGLEARHASVYLLAGSLYEEGLCLKPNWERAERMYRLAHEAGHRAGLLRLVAGLALDGREPASALWMAQQAQDLALPDTCRVAEPLWRDPDRFVATVARWPAGRLDQCVYVAGVMAQVSGDANYPRRALANHLSGTVAMRYTPATGSIQWRTVQTQAQPLGGVADIRRLDEQDSRRTHASLERHMRTIGERAIQRFRQPEGLDPTWQLDVQYVFRIRP